MKLYIMRHGNSPPASGGGSKADAERCLSEEGRREARGSIQKLIELGGKPKIILHSPLKRAVQTAEEAAGLLHLQGYTEIFKPLSNILGPEDLYKDLTERCIGVEETLIVGHQPQLGELASWMADGVYSLPTGGIIALETRPNNPAALLWAHKP